MKQESQTNQIEYSCFYKQCKFCRCLCKFCKLDVNHQHKTHIASQEDYLQQQQIMKQSIRNAEFKISNIGNTNYLFDAPLSNEFVQAISNDLKYVATGRSDLQIWDHTNKNLIKTTLFKTDIEYVKFTDDSKILYVLSLRNKLYKLYKLNVNKQFKQVQTYQLESHQTLIRNISNEIFLSSIADCYIRKLNFQQKQQFKIKVLFDKKVHSHNIIFLDYNKSLNMIVTLYQNSISLCNANDGQLLIRKQLAQHRPILTVLFMINNQLISQDSSQLVIVWNIDFETKQLCKQKCLKNIQAYIQLVLHKQFILSFNQLSEVEIHSIDGELIKKFAYYYNDRCKIKYSINFFNIDDFKSIQPDSMQSCLIFGESVDEFRQFVLIIKFD